MGFYANELGVRLSSHPGQYVVLNSASERVSFAAARDVELQAWLFDAMGLGPDAVVVLHVAARKAGTRRERSDSCAPSSGSPSAPARGS